MFNTLLIANRGEIACRIAATARHMGIRTVAVFSNADKHAKHVKACDTAVYIGESEPSSSYLKIENIIKAAKESGAQAIHPGYGFLAENEAFAQACADAGLIFVGPSAKAIAAMGNKSAAKALMEKANVPLVPGYHGDNQDPDFLQQEAEKIGYPILIKATAGGGGVGMRIVDKPEQFHEALLSCQREAEASFGNKNVLIERFLTKPRHVEIQIFADNHGHVVHLFERDCSIQRRYQKVIEEAPAPGLSEKQRAAMGQAAVAAAKAVGYVGAGTVEFIMAPDGEFFFMEMNTRLQVEHPITELITGQDLVQWQLLVASGKPLPLSQEQLTFSGHAIEARIYAENPENNFLPSIGELKVLNWPEHTEFDFNATHLQQLPLALRIDSGVNEGDVISPFYDPMIAKLIVYGQDRQTAIHRMKNALALTQVVGVDTNIAFLHRIFSEKSFVQAKLDTGFIERLGDKLFIKETDFPSDTVLALAAASLLATQGIKSSHLNQNSAYLAKDPWSVKDHWRVSELVYRTLRFVSNGKPCQINLTKKRNHWFFSVLKEITSEPIEKESIEFQWQVQLRKKGQYDVTIQIGNQQIHAQTIVLAHEIYVFYQGQTHQLSTQIPGLYGDDAEQKQDDGLVAPMPGKIITLFVKEGDQVKSGDKILVMEAMKMEHTLYAPNDGTVKEIFYQEGDQVSDGVELVFLQD